MHAAAEDAERKLQMALNLVALLKQRALKSSSTDRLHTLTGT